MHRGFKKNPPAVPPVILQRHLIQLMPIRDLIANGAVGMGKTCCSDTSRNGATSFLAHFPIEWSIYCAFPYWKLQHSELRFTAPLLGILYQTSYQRHCQLYDVKKGAGACVKLCALLAVGFPIADRSGTESLKGSHPLPLMKACKFIPLSARSISIDTTFKCFLSSTGFSPSKKLVQGEW